MFRYTPNVLYSAFGKDHLIRTQNFPYAKLAFLIPWRAHVRVYQWIRNVRVLENFEHVLNKWPLSTFGTEFLTSFLFGSICSILFNFLFKRFYSALFDSRKLLMKFLNKSRIAVFKRVIPNFKTIFIFPFYIRFPYSDSLNFS